MDKHTGASDTIWYGLRGDPGDLPPYMDVRQVTRIRFVLFFSVLDVFMLYRLTLRFVVV